jgi:hypothetical protein
MKLYELPRKEQRVRCLEDDQIYTFYHVDGMYSLCKNFKGDVVHLAAWSEVEILEDECLS